MESGLEIGLDPGILMYPEQHILGVILQLCAPDVYQARKVMVA